MDTSFNDKNRRERERMKALVDRLSDDDLRRKVNDRWTVAAYLLHVGFWDARNRWLSDKQRRGEPFTKDDVEPDDVTWINESMRPFLHAVPAREAARLALRLAETADEGVASPPPGGWWPDNEKSLVNPLRAAHRAEHLDQIEEALAKSSP